METVAIVLTLNVNEQLVASGIVIREDNISTVVFERTEKAFDHGIVITIARTARAG
jgi:hypothetical protein